MSLKYHLSKPFLPLVAQLSAFYLRRAKPSRNVAERLFSSLNRNVNHHGFVFEAETAFGRIMRVDIQDFLQNKIFYFGLWEPKLTQLILSRPENDGIFLDIGANIGYFSMAAAARFKKVIAIEASPDIAALLKRNVERNQLTNIDIKNIAIGNAEGKIFVNLAAEHNVGQTAISQDRKSGSKEIQMTTIDRLLGADELGNIRFIKMDVEGAEFSIFENLLTFVNALHPELEIVAEISPAETPDDEADQIKIWAALLEAGFTAYVLQEEYDLGDYLEDNFVEADLKSISARPAKQTDILFRRH